MVFIKRKHNKIPKEQIARKCMGCPTTGITPLGMQIEGPSSKAASNEKFKGKLIEQQIAAIRKDKKRGKSVHIFSKNLQRDSTLHVLNLPKL